MSGSHSGTFPAQAAHVPGPISVSRGRGRLSKPSAASSSGPSKKRQPGGGKKSEAEKDLVEYEPDDGEAV